MRQTRHRVPSAATTASERVASFFLTEGTVEPVRGESCENYDCNAYHAEPAPPSDGPLAALSENRRNEQDHDRVCDGRVSADG